MRAPPPSTELKIARLETRETVFLALIKAEIATSAKKTDVAKPLPFWNSGQRGVETKDVKSFGNKVKHTF
jgi:hypothetical protein